MTMLPCRVSSLFLVLLLALLSAGREIVRSKRQLSDSSLKLICDRRPTFSFCPQNDLPPPPEEESAETQAPEEDPDESLLRVTCLEYRPLFEKHCLSGRIGQDATTLCEDYSHDCGVPLPAQTNELPEEPTQEALNELCRQYWPTFEKNCLSGKIEDNVRGNCEAYKRDCGVARPVEGGSAAGGPEDPFVGLPVPPAVPGETQPEPRQEPRNPFEEAVASVGREDELRAACRQYEDVARLHCMDESIDPGAVEFCAGWFRDCYKYLDDDEPLKKAANLFSSNVGWSTDNWGVRGIPFYPINREGAIGGGKDADVDFGSWGGGYRESSGVRDFWSQGTQAGGNWYDGLYGGQSSWGVPILSQWGVSGKEGTQVRVPINERNFGEPIGINSGLGVGNWWSNGDQTKIDWLNGNVGGGSGWGLPFLGISGNTGSSVRFPSVADFLPLGKKKK